MQKGYRRPHSLYWLSCTLLGLGACLRPLPQASSQGNTTKALEESSSSQESSSSESSSDMSDSSQKSSSSEETSDTESQESKKPPPPRNELRRLTPTQVRNALQSVFAPKDSAAFDVALALPITYNNDAFSNDTRYQQLSPQALSGIQAAAARVGNYIAAHRNARELSGCEKSKSEIECVEMAIHNIGGQLFRLPLTKAQSEGYLNLYQDLAKHGSASFALAGLIQALVSSPHFHYLPPRVDPKQHAYLIAARLSLFLWNDLPDQALLQSAKDQTLLQTKVLATQARRMLAAPKAKAMIRDFYLQMLRLGAIEVRSHPHASREDLLASFGQHIARVYEEDSLKALWTLPVELDAEELKTHFPGQYPGLLAHPIFNWVHAKPTYSDPIARGAVIREQVFCNALRAPPPDVQMLLPAPRPDATTRERFEMHRNNPSCASCHSLIDPLGFGFEAYDHLGRFRDQENNKPIDDKGALVATDVNGSFQGVLELSTKLVESKDVRSCLAEQWLSYGLGRPLKGRDEALLQELIEKASKQDKALSELLFAIATSEIISDQEPPQ